MKGTTDFLFEIGCEEIPAGMLPGAVKELQAILEKYLKTYNLLLEAPVETLGAPRRLAASCASIRDRQPDEVRELTGPPKSVAYDPAGKPTRAAESFAQKVGHPGRQIYDGEYAEGRIPFGEAGDQGKAGDGNSGRFSAARGGRDHLAAEYVLDRRRRSAVHPPDPLGGGPAGRESRCNSRWATPKRGIARQGIVSWGSRRSRCCRPRTIFRSCARISCWCGPRSAGRRSKRNSANSPAERACAFMQTRICWTW